MLATTLLTRLTGPALGEGSEAPLRVDVKRAREQGSSDDGMRILVDRSWPRGVRREDLIIDLWLKEAAPSVGLLSRHGRDSDRWATFSRSYRAEVSRRADLLQLLDDLRQRGRLTLLSDATDLSLSHATLLREVLLERRFETVASTNESRLP